MGLVTQELNIPGVWEPCPGAIIANTFITLLEWVDYYLVRVTNQTCALCWATVIFACGAAIAGS
jgi:hypothetical protein